MQIDIENAYEALGILEDSNSCTFWACPGPDHVHLQMATCIVCQTIQAFQKEFYGVAIIAMCGKVGNATPMLKVARQLGAVEVLQKPFFSHELLAVVDRVLKSEVRMG